MRKMLAALLIGWAAAAGAQAPTVLARPVTSAPAPTVTAAAPAAASDAAIAGFVDGYIANAVDQLGLPSASVSVVRDGRTILLKSYGYADLKSGRRATPDTTLYRQASISKLFTWLVVMQQVEAGKLDLDKDVNTYLDFRIPDAFGKPVTLRHLMTHTAGFDERYRGIFDALPPPELGRLLRENIPARVYPPGQTMAYSNYGAALAGYIAERAAGKPLLTLIQERILTPLGMAHSSFVQPLPPGLAPLVASGYAPGSREAMAFEYVGAPGAGGLSSTAADMTRFMTMLLNGGSLDGVQVVRPETLAAMLRVTRPLGPGLPAGIGLGFIGGTRDGVRTMGHGGNLTGSATLLQLLPDAHLGIYMAFNGQGNGGAAGHVRRDLIPALITRFAGGVAVPVKAIAAAQSTAAEVAGAYVTARRSHFGLFAFPDLIDPTIVAEDKDGAIAVSTATRSDGSIRRWLPVARDRFAEAESGSPLVFERGPDGAVRGMAGELVYPVAEYDRMPGWLASVVPVLSVALGIIVVTALAWPAGRILRGAWRVRPIQAPRRGRRWYPWARLGAWAVVAALLVLALYFTKSQGDLAMVSNGADPWLMAIRIAMALAALGCVALILDAFSAWRDGTRGVWRKLWALIAGLAALAIVAAILQFGLVTFSTSY